MSDDYIDIQEMQTHSATFLAAAANYSGPSPMPAYLIASHKPVLDQIVALIQRKVASKSDYHSSHTSRRSVADEVSQQLRLLHGELKTAEAKGQVTNFLAYFPSGRLSDIGGSIADRKASLERCLTALDSSPGFSGQKEWKESLSALAEKFSTAVDETSRKDLSKWSDDKEFTELRRTWKRNWLACKRGMEATLLLEGKESELPAYFPDLLVSTRTSTKPAKE
jgi:hypothetical protein